MGHRPDLGHEGMPTAPDLTDGTAPHQHPLRRAFPVHPPELHFGIVPAPVENIGFGDLVRAQRARRILCVHREIGAGADLAGRQPAFRFEFGAVEGQRPVVIGEANR